MKLITCYIENFGNLKQRNFNFGDKLTSYCEGNGYGKTTLASFLKAMFYGLKQTTARDKELGERARFYPFEGGKFGGNVTLEKDGATYKIERFFGRKSATEDTLTVYKNGKAVTVEDLGKEIFGLDEQSFLRTVFINSSDTESGATGDISRMLNGFVDDANFEGAKKWLEERKKELKLVRGRGGKIDDKHDEIVGLKKDIENKEKIKDGLGQKYGERKELAGAVALLEKRQNSSRDSNLILQKWQTYDGLVSDAEGEKEKLNNLARKYPSGLPEESEVQELKRRVEALNLANERQASATFSADKKYRLEELSARFKEGTPMDGEISSANEKVAEIIRLDAEIAGLENSVKGSLENAFATGIPDKEELKKYGEKLASLRGKCDVRQVGKVSKKLPLLLAVLAVVCAGAGIGLLFVNAIFGGIFLGLCGVLALAGIFTYFKGQISGMTAITPSGNSEAENEIRSYLARYGYYSDGGVEVDYNNLVRDLEIYNSNLENSERNERLLREKRAELDEAKTALSSFLKRYAFSGENAQSELNRLGALVAEYVALNAEKADVSARLGASRADIEKHTQIIDNILKKYGIEKHVDLSGLCAEVERDRTEFDRLKASAERLEKRASEYRQKEGLKERPQGEREDIQSIDEELSKLRDKLSFLDREIRADEDYVEGLDELKEELEIAEEEEQNLKAKYKLIIKTLEMLERAEGSLKDRYISPVKESFLNYSNLLEKVLGEKVTFDKDFKVKFERGGEDRSDGHLSAGQKSLCALCLRLALIDNMYRGEKPFIIMDDPFVHLDRVHMDRAQELLKGLALERQIIYFCCHESRKI